MNLLLDTHILIWLDSDQKRLPGHVALALLDPENRLLISVASLWEMQIKLQLGKLRLPSPLEELVRRQRTGNAVELVEVRIEHVLAVGQLPSHHNDPFDRLIAATAIVEDARLVTVDRVFENYPVRLFQAN